MCLDISAQKIFHNSAFFRDIVAGLKAKCRSEGIIDVSASYFAAKEYEEDKK